MVWLVSSVHGLLRWLIRKQCVGYLASLSWGWQYGCSYRTKIEEEKTQISNKLGVFGATLVTFFLAAMGDKTQLATIALAAHYGTPFLVIIGATLGMLIADIPAVFVGNKFSEKIPMKLVHSIAAGIFTLMGVLAMMKVEKPFP